MTKREKILDDSIRELSYTLSKTDDEELIREFLSALLTPKEVKEIASRWALVKLIGEGVSQRKIAEQLELSLCKITRGSREYKKENSSFKKMIDITASNSNS